jgi:hypothetical protein
VQSKELDNQKIDYILARNNSSFALTESKQIFGWGIVY